MENLTPNQIPLMSQQPFNPDEYTPIGTRFNGGVDLSGRNVIPYEPTGYKQQEQLFNYAFTLQGYKVVKPFSTGWVMRPYKTLGWLFLPLHSCKAHTRGTYLEFIVSSNINGLNHFVGMSYSLEPTTDKNYHWTYAMFKVNKEVHSNLFKLLEQLSGTHYWGYLK